MRVGIATDHGGFALKEELVAQLRTAGYEIIDFGANSLNPDDDYPDFVVPLGRAVAAGQVERGVAICGSGVGASVCANKIPGCSRSGNTRPLFGAAGGRGRSHEHSLHGRPDGGSGGGLGPRPHILERRVQRRRTTSTPVEQDSVSGRSVSRADKTGLIELCRFQGSLPGSRVARVPGRDDGWTDKTSVIADRDYVSHELGAYLAQRGVALLRPSYRNR